MSNHAVVALLLLVMLLPFHVFATNSNILMTSTESSPEFKTESSIESMYLAGPLPSIAANVETSSPCPIPDLVNSGPKLETRLPSQVRAPDVILDPSIRMAMPWSPKKLGVPSRICTYNIEVQTGTEWGAGTDSTISMQLSSSNSSDADHEVFQLPDFDNDSNKFEAGNNDKFQVQTKCVTNICRMTLYTDHKGWFADWFVEKLSVTLADGAPTEYHNWILHQWLPATGGPLFIVKDDCY